MVELFKLVRMFSEEGSDSSFGFTDIFLFLISIPSILADFGRVIACGVALSMKRLSKSLFKPSRRLCRFSVWILREFVRFES